MTDLKMYDYYNLVKDKSIILFFKGAISQELLVDIGSLIKNQISISKQLKKVFSVFIELTQNIMHYSQERIQSNDKDVGVGLVVITESNGNYSVYSGNKIGIEKSKIITQRIDFINTKTVEELKEMYKVASRREPPAGSKGAGLGLIDIARKSGNQIKYDTLPLNNESNFLIVQANISEEE